MKSRNRSNLVQNEENSESATKISVLRKNSFYRVTDPDQVLLILLDAPIFIKYFNDLLREGDFHPDEICQQISPDSPGLKDFKISLCDVVPGLIKHFIKPMLENGELFCSEIDRRYRWDSEGVLKKKEDEFMAWSRSAPAAELIDILFRAKVVNRSQTAALLARFDGLLASDMYLASCTENTYRLSSVLLQVKGVSVNGVEKIFRYITRECLS